MVSIGPAQTFLQVEYRRVWCPNCQKAKVEQLTLLDAGPVDLVRLSDAAGGRASCPVRGAGNASVNERLSAVHQLKDQLKMIYRYKRRVWAKKAIDQWCRMAAEIDHPLMRRFIGRLRFFKYGILNHAEAVPGSR